MIFVNEKLKLTFHHLMLNQSVRSKVFCSQICFTIRCRNVTVVFVFLGESLIVMILRNSET